MLEIERLLAQTLGLNVESVGRAVVHRAVQERMTRCGVGHVEQYHARLLRDGDELQELIEELVVSETWFFRNPEALTRLVELFTTEWPPMLRGTVRRVLSVPCATGEEPYSIAIALAEAGLTRREVQIDAIDISRRALARAEKGVYGQNSLRGEASRVCERYSYRVPGGIAILPEIRHSVRFAYGNLVASSFRPPSSSYDAIFCRNVLIYLERAAQEHVLGVLHQLLVPDGYLFVGHAEGPLAAECGFRVMADTMAFVCQKVPRGMALPRAEARASERAVVKSMVKPVAVVVEPHSGRPSHVRPHQQAESALLDRRQSRGVPHTMKAEGRAAVGLGPAVPPPVPMNGTLERARQLADEGRLTEAADLCTAYLRDSGTAAEAFYLLGLVQDARGNVAEAVAYYRKALFLDPNHGDASAQLAIHAQRAGDPAGAERLRARAQRIERRQTL